MLSPAIRIYCWIIGLLLLIGLPVWCLSAVSVVSVYNSAHPTHIKVTEQLTTSLSSLLYLPLVVGPTSRLLIAAAHIDSVISGEADEAILLWNVGGATQPLAGWQLTTATRRATFPMTGTLQLAPGQRLWCAAEASTFRLSFGEDPACEWADDSDPAISDLLGSLTLANSGGRVQLLNANGQVVDTLIYGDEVNSAEGWIGPAVQLYTRGAIPSAGQIWQRKFDLNTGQPIDHDRASDWASDLADLVWGRRVRMPGWQGWGETDLGAPTRMAASATVTVAVGPEGLYAPLAAALASASRSIDLSTHTFEHPDLARILAAATLRGVRVRLFLEGAPPGGITDAQKWCVAEIATAGGDVRYLAPTADAPKGYRPRYQYMHAKYAIIDDRLALIGTENFSYDAMPVDAVNPVGGRRGFYLFTNAQAVVVAFQQLFATDWAPDRFRDLHPFEAGHAAFGAPPPDFVFPPLPLYPVTESPFREPTVTQGSANFMLISAPENAIRPDTGIHALIQRAGAGDEILLMQLYERKYWGDSVSNPIADPNPRLQAIIEAARRGARVRLLLDRFFDDSSELRSNQATVAYVQAIASAEQLDLEARTGNPTLGGIHAKVLLIRVGNEHWSAVGSLNGGEISHKLNREVILATDLADVYTRLAQVFLWDWNKPFVESFEHEVTPNSRLRHAPKSVE